MAPRFEPNALLRSGWPLASVATAAPSLGCGPGDVEVGLRITSLAFDGDGTLTLSFSQPLANADAIDANGAVGLVRDRFGVTNLTPQLRIPCP